jgi:membrane-bound lytic murein transglycosylase D
VETVEETLWSYAEPPDAGAAVEAAAAIDALSMTPPGDTEAAMPVAPAGGAPAVVPSVFVTEVEPAPLSGSAEPASADGIPWTDAVTAVQEGVAEDPPPLPERAPSSETMEAVGQPSTEIVAVDGRFERVSALQGRPVGVLRVDVEETLGHYAEWAGVRARDIRRLNGLAFGRTLHLNQEIRIPLDRVPSDAFEEQRYEYHKRLQEDFFAAYRTVEADGYMVQPGDTLWNLCRERFDIPPWLLRHYNPDVDFAVLRPRQLLKIPGIEKTAAGDPGTVSDGNGEEVEGTD